MRLDHTTEVPEYLWEAARVSRFMRNERTERWQLHHFTVTEAQYNQKMLVLKIRGDQPDFEMAREVPPGDYISLRRKMLRDEKLDVIREQKGEGMLELVMESRGISEDQAIDLFVPRGSHDWMPVMSDTPSEILEHDHALNNATGVVVITGLGLGCLPHALLAKPGVTRIHIIEIDPEVIRLTGKYLTDPRVTIHQGSATAVKELLPEGLRADYVWHDIWSHISSRNFDAATAEHGISYDMLFDLYAEHLDVGDTGAWAYREALLQQQHLDEERSEELEFRRRLRALPTLDEQVDAAWRRVLERRIRPAVPWGPDDEIPLAMQRILDPDLRLRAHLYTTLGAPDFWEKFDRDHEDEDDVEPLGRPNAHLEA